MRERIKMKAQIKSKLLEQKNSFYIQLGHPVANIPEEEVFRDIRSVFPEVFSENSESAYLFWQQIPIRFHYTYELYWNLEALVDLFIAMQSDNSGSYHLFIQTEILIGEWNVDWQNDSVKLRSKWTGKDMYSPLAELLNKKAPLLLHKQVFLEEWKGILQQSSNVLGAINFKDLSVRSSFLEKLHSVLNKIDNVGQLYKR